MLRSPASLGAIASPPHTASTNRRTASRSVLRRLAKRRKGKGNPARQGSKQHCPVARTADVGTRLNLPAVSAAHSSPIIPSIRSDPIRKKESLPKRSLALLTCPALLLSQSYPLSDIQTPQHSRHRIVSYRIVSYHIIRVAPNKNHRQTVASESFCLSGIHSFSFIPSFVAIDCPSTPASFN